MKTRSRTVSQSVAADEIAVVQVGPKKKAPQKQSDDALVANIISSIKEENTTKKTNNDSNSNSNATKKPVQKIANIRGQPKSGRPWKEVKKR